MLALTGWWFLRNRALYGDWTGNNIVAQMWCCDPIQPWPALRLFLTGLLGRFGQGLMITYPNPIYYAAAVVGLFALAGWLVALAARRRAPSESTRPEALLWGLHLGMVLVVCGSLVLYAAWVAPGLPGRYLFPAFPSLAVLIAGGWLAWFPPRWRTAGALALAGLTLAATLYALWGLLIPTYAPPPTASAATLSRATPLDANIGDTAQVLGYTLASSTVQPGGILQVTIYWQPLSRTDVPYTVFLQLYDPSQGVIAQIDSFPGLGNYATTVWDVGRPIVDVYRLKIPPDAPAAQAELVFGLYNGNDGVRLPVTGADAGPADLAWVQFGHIMVTP
jgi:hypothetical protein